MKKRGGVAEWWGAGRGLWRWDADVFIPEFGVGGDEGAHELDAALIVKMDDGAAVGGEPVFAALEGLVLADDDAWDAMEDGGAGAHGAG